jgi:hypothetical protein
VEFKVYESPRIPCDLCGSADSIYIAICKQNEDEQPSRSYTFNGVEIERAFVLHACRNCKIPYETIPVIVSLDKGYLFAAYSSLLHTPVILEPEDKTIGGSDGY